MILPTNLRDGAHRRWFVLIVAAIIVVVSVLCLFVFHSIADRDARPILRVGDQRGGIEALLGASGYADNAGYKIEWSRFPSGMPLIEAINAGAIDVGVVGDGSLIIARSAHVPIKAVSTVRDVVGGSRLFVASDSEIRTVADLKGRSIGVQRGSAMHLMVLNILSSAGLGAKDVDLKFLAPDEARAAFVGGRIDAWAAIDPFVAIEEASSKPARILVNGDNFMINAIYVVARQEAITNKRALIADFIARTRNAYTWSADNPAAYATLLAKETGMPVAIARRIVDHRRPRFADVDPALVAQLDKAIGVYRTAGLADFPVVARDLFDTSFPISSLPEVKSSLNGKSKH